jgi:ADP-heptose:LPS heptosyltransferase
MTVVVPIVAGIGNALLAVPMVRQLKRGRPDARVTILARIEPMAEVFRRLPEVDEVLVTGGGLKGNWRNVSWARKRRADVYLVPFPSNGGNTRCWRSRAARSDACCTRTPWVTGVRCTYCRRDAVPSQRGIHDVVQNLNLLRELGIEPDASDAPTFRVNDVDRVKADELLTLASLAKDEPFIAVHAGSAKTVLARAKRWPAANYAKLIDAMSREFGLPVALLEGPAEAGVASEILLHAPPSDARVATIPLRGGLGDAAALLARATLYVGSDSGLAHLAAALARDRSRCSGPADPDRVSPFGYRDLVVQSPQNCGPCFLYPWDTPYPKTRCREPYCIDSITVEAVMEKVTRAMSALVPSPSGRRLG